MPNTPSVTVRETIEPPVTQEGLLRVYISRLEVQTTDRVELVDLTAAVRQVVRRSGVGTGTATLWSMHTTCAVLINEVQPALHADIKRFFAQAVAQDGDWMHNDPAHSDCDRSNADAHLRAMLLGHSLTLHVFDGDVVLGTWQRTLAAEMDGPRTRAIRVQVMGIPRN
jgi:secondary thiamine-phosphate synthase enzyme